MDPSVEEEYRGEEVNREICMQHCGANTNRWAFQLLSHPSVTGSVMVVYLPSLGELTAIKQLGKMTPEKLTKVGEVQDLLSHSYTVWLGD